MATATTKLHAAAALDRASPAVPERTSAEFRIDLDDGGRDSSEIVDMRFDDRLVGL
jgi:hypothetical protein